MVNDRLDQHLFPQDSPYNTGRDVTSAYEFDTSYEVQGKLIRSSKIRTNNFVSGTISGTIITAGNINSDNITGTSTITAGTVNSTELNSTEVNSGSVVTSSVLGTILITPNGITVQSGTSSGTLISLVNTGGTNSFQVYLDSDFAKLNINEVDFTSNLNNKLIENFGVTAKLADTAGFHSFWVNDSNNDRVWQFASNGQAKMLKAGWFEILGSISDPGGGPSHSGRLFVQENGGKDELRVEFNTGASVVVATEP